MKINFFCGRLWRFGRLKLKKSRFFLCGFFLIILLGGCAPSWHTDVEIVVDEIDELSNFIQGDDLEYAIIDSEFKLPIFLFHHIGNAPESATASERQWYVSEKRFEEIVKMISEKGYNPLLIGEFTEFVLQKKLPENSIMLTFDDGSSDFHSNAFPILKKYGVKANVFLMTGVKSDLWLNLDQQKELYESGLVQFGSHTVYHAYLTKITKKELVFELQQSLEYLRVNFPDQSHHILSYPYGLYNEEVINKTKEAGYFGALALKEGVKQSLEGLFEMKRIVITENKDVSFFLN